MEVMAESLRDAGFEVVEAVDGIQAVALLSQSPKRFTVLVTDFHMPGGLDGAQVALRGRAAVPDLPVIIATGRPDVIQRSWRDEFGFAVLKKPYLPRELLTLVRLLVKPTRS